MHKHGPHFWTGNALLAAALAMLFFMGPLAEQIGVWAMGLWMGVAAAGMYLVTRDGGQGPDLPD